MNGFPASTLPTVEGIQSTSANANSGSNAPALKPSVRKRQRRDDANDQAAEAGELIEPVEKIVAVPLQRRDRAGKRGLEVHPAVVLEPRRRVFQLGAIRVSRGVAETLEAVGDRLEVDRNGVGLGRDCHDGVGRRRVADQRPLRNRRRWDVHRMGAWHDEHARRPLHGG